MSSGHYCDGCAQAYYKCVCNKQQEKVKEQTIKMNQRIKQLWEEAAKTTQGDSWEEQTKFMERFAELIVRECMQIAKDHTTGPYEMGMSKKTHTAWNIYMDIADRFGTNNEQQI